MTPLDALKVPLAGCNLIEASAGCGKTHSITTLFVRLVVEQGLEVSRILVVTYTRAATAELRDRVRRRLRDALDALDALSAADARAACDELVRYFAERRGHRALDERRLQAALRDFDEAAILTIHGFCQRVLADHAFESGSRFEVQLVQDLLPLVDDVSRDFWASRYYEASAPLVRHARKKNAGPSDLIDLARRVHASANLRVLPELEAAAEPMPDLIAEWYVARDEAAAAWLRDATSLRAFLLGAGLHKRWYGDDHIKSWCKDMEGLQDHEPPGVPTCVTKLSVGKLSAKKGLRVDQPCFIACERLVQADERLSAALDAVVLATRRQLISHVRHELTVRKERQGQMGFDDLLRTLHEALKGSAAPALMAGVRARYGAALVDEFQDTDPIQYAIFHALFAHDERPLFLIGDPKQAIYAFRGADVFAYMDAAKSSARAVWSLARNYRSDPGLLDALDWVFSRLNDPFLHPGIEFARVQPRPEAHDALRLHGESLAAFEILFADTGERSVTKGAAERVLPRCVAEEIVRLLRSGATLRSGPSSQEERVEARHVAVLCRTNRQAASMQEALRAYGIPSVLEGDSSVFDTALCEELERVLRAMAQPGDAAKVRAALATSVLGEDHAALASMHKGDDEGRWDGWVASFAEWNRTWRERGFIQAFHRMLDERSLQAALLARPDGQRLLTNLLHLGELLHEASTTQHLGPLSLLHWLSQMRLDDERRGAFAGESEQLRLESDEHAVRLTTIHKSKGLEYPIVYCPFLWPEPFKPSAAYSVFHDMDESGAPLTIDLRGAQAKQHQHWQLAEELTESLRVLYVALTRARHRCSVVWGKLGSSDESALAHLLHAPVEQVALSDFDGDAVIARREQSKAHVKGASAEQLFEELRARAASVSGLSVRKLSLQLDAGFAAAAPATQSAPPELQARVSQRRLLRHFRISSFSALTAQAGHAASALSDEGLDLDEREPDAAALQPRNEPARKVRLHDFPRGARAGTLVHHVFEHLDFMAPRAALDAHVRDSLQRYGYGGALGESLAESLSDGIARCLATPLTLDATELCLAQVSRTNRIDELEFLLPVAEAPAARLLTATALGSAFETHRAPAASPDYGRRVRELRFDALSGYLKGFVDLVFRDGDRYFIVDYKSNHLGDHAADYAPERLALAMEASHYHLQAHLYAVALHRHLTQRLGERYDYARNFGGVFYLFVRGMSPEHSPGAGVFADRPSLALLQALEGALSDPGARQ